MRKPPGRQSIRGQLGCVIATMAALAVSSCAAHAATASIGPTTSSSSVVISFSATPGTITVTLVPLAAGWRGFAFEYSPGPFYYSPTGPGEIPPRDAGLTFTAMDLTGRPIDARHLDVDTNAQHEVTAPRTR